MDRPRVCVIAAIEIHAILDNLTMRYDTHDVGGDLKNAGRFPDLEFVRPFGATPRRIHDPDRASHNRRWADAQIWLCLTEQVEVLRHHSVLKRSIDCLRVS